MPRLAVGRGRGFNRRNQGWRHGWGDMPRDFESLFAGAISWRDPSIGVVTDNSTDNTTALNTLPTGVPILCDGGPALFTGNWNLRSNLLLYFTSGGKLISTKNVGAGATGSIQQADMTTPLTNITIYGLDIEKQDSSTQLGRMIVLYVNGLTIKGFRVGPNNGVFHLRGSDQEVSWGSIHHSNAASGGGRVGIRHYGNVPKVTTTGGKPANLWFHHIFAFSGDGTFQVSQTDQGPFANVSADDYLYEDCWGQSLGGPLILNGQSDRTGNTFTCTCTNGVYQRISGIGKKRVIDILNADNTTPADMTDLLFKDLLMDATEDVDPTASVSVTGGDVSAGDTSAVRRVNFQNLTVFAPFLQAFRSTGYVYASSMINSSLGAPRSQTSGYNAQLRDGDGFLFSNVLCDASSGGINLGNKGFPSTNPIVSACLITDVADTKAGVLMQDVDGAVSTSNIISADPVQGTSTAKGYIFTKLVTESPATTNSSVTGGDVSGCTNNPTIIYASGQGNSVTGVVGSPDHSG